MTAHQLIGVAVRLFAIFIVVQILPLIGYGLSISSNDEMRNGRILYFAFLPCLLVMAALLWKFPLTIANKLIPNTLSEDKVEFPFDQFARLSIVVFALWILITKVLTQIAYLLPLLIYISRNHDAVANHQEFEFIRIAPIVIEFVVAVLLIKNSKSLSKFLMKN